MKACSRCGVVLTEENARQYQGRWVGKCRQCEKVLQARWARDRDLTTLAVRIPDPLHKRLRAAAEERQLSVARLTTEALEEFLDHLVPVEELHLTRRPA